VQLRKENASGTALNLVGFQTRLSWPAQREAFGKLPGLERADWLRLGVMHRNAFVDSPRVLDADLRLRAHPSIRLAGQITGAEGYVEAAACGAIAAIGAAREMLGLPRIAVPVQTALGAVVAHLQNAQTPDFQPANVTWAFVPPLEGPETGKLPKRERRRLLAERALAALDEYARHLQRERPRATSFAAAGY
jgi:methylenetetrahydrofolate--tRNA-(uracil-5-)-methyltransferase